MAKDNSVVTVCADTDKASVNQAMAAFYGDDSGSEELSVPLSASGSAPATHWGAANFVTGAQATALKDWPTGTLPTPLAPWSGYGLDDTTALAAGAKMIQSVMTGADFNTLAMTNFEAAIASLGLTRVA